MPGHGPAGDAHGVQRCFGVALLQALAEISSLPIMEEKLVASAPLPTPLGGNHDKGYSYSKSARANDLPAKPMDFPTPVANPAATGGDPQQPATQVRQQLDGL